MQTIRVKLETSPYDVLIARGLLQHSADRILQVQQPTLVLVVTSRKIRRLCGAKLQRSLRHADLRFSVVEIPDGERAKSMATSEFLLRRFAALGADRKSSVIALGGGVIGDTAGFAASVYMRGIPVVQVPTTVLAQVDASIGGKTGVNLAAGKNLVGTFHQPALVLIDPDALRTLPEREYRAGIYEAIKCGVVRDAKLFAFIEQNTRALLERDPDAVMRVITDAVQVKADVVAADERESGLRRILNFGHTVGHALEAASGYRHFLHGEAVAWGMIAASEIGANEGTTPVDVAERIVAATLALGALPKVKVSPGRVAKFITRDKKTSDGVSHFVLPTKIGSVRIVGGIDHAVVRNAIASLQA